MKLPSLVRLPRNRSFNFEPRYYDPVKEDIARRKRLAAAALANGTDNTQASERQAEAIRERISMHYRRSARQDKRSTMIQVAIAGILIALFFAIFG